MQHFANFRRKSNCLTFQNSHEYGQFVEEFVNLQEQNITAVQPVIRNEPATEQKDNMEVTTDLELQDL